MTWESAWAEGRTGWDAGAPAPALVRLLETGSLPPGRALVPGCGSGYDVFALARAGYDAHGLDIAPTAARRFEQARGGLPGAQIHTDDFFTPAQDLGRFDVLWDYTFLCAIPPGLRPAWAARHAALLANGGVLATLLFPVVQDDPTPTTDEDPGPPYRLHPGWVTELLGEHGLERVSLETVEKSHPGRQGLEHLALWRR